MGDKQNDNWAFYVILFNGQEREGEREGSRGLHTTSTLSTFPTHPPLVLDLYYKQRIMYYFFYCGTRTIGDIRKNESHYHYYHHYYPPLLSSSSIPAPLSSSQNLPQYLHGLFVIDAGMGISLPLSVLH